MDFDVTLDLLFDELVKRMQIDHVGRDWLNELLELPDCPLYGVDKKTPLSEDLFLMAIESVCVYTNYALYRDTNGPLEIIRAEMQLGFAAVISIIDISLKWEYELSEKFESIAKELYFGGEKFSLTIPIDHEQMYFKSNLLEQELVPVYEI